MRADRLIALVLFLQRRGKGTSSQVAAELEVSVATARRDLESLAAAGVPVYAQPGRNGGWQLVGGARTDLSGLSGHETKALFWMLGTAGLSDPGTRMATHKLIRALPESLRAEAETLATTVHYDHRPWGEVTETGAEAVAGDSPGTNLLDSIREALVRHVRLDLRYTHRNSQMTDSRLIPRGLVAKAGIWYLVAGDEDVRSYRIDRIVGLTVTEDEFEPDRGDQFDLVEFWHREVTAVESLRSATAAKVRIPTWAVPILRQQFGRYFEVIDERAEKSDDAVVLAEVRANLVVALAEQLAGWGSRIDVLDPPELRRELGRIGAELSAQYHLEQ